MGSKAEHLVTLIVVSGGDAGAGARNHRRGRVNSYSTTEGSKGNLIYSTTGGRGKIYLIVRGS